MKTRGLCLLVAVLTAFVAGAGCGAGEARTRFTEPNEILTYDRIDPDRTQITVSSLGNNADVDVLAAAFMQANPDVQVICIDTTGGTTDYRPVIDWVVNGAAPDVMFVNPDSFTDDAIVKTYLEDLSASPVIGNFEAASLNRVAVDGCVYFLPAPSEINCIIYNKTLFEQYGWSTPATFDEFVALCVQIREDTGGTVQPWNPNAKYDLVFSTALEAFTYTELFGGLDNRAWYNDFCEGKASFAGHMEPFFAMVQTLIDNGILLAEQFDYSATTRGKEFQAGQIAMYNAPISRMSSELYTFDYMPYPATAGEVGYVNDYYSSMLCVPKKAHTDAERDAIDRFVAFFGTVEGQQAVIGDTLMVSNVKGVPLNDSEAMQSIKDVIEQGHVFSRLDFPGSNKIDWSTAARTETEAGRPAERTWSFRECAQRMVAGEATGAELIAEIDQKPYRTAAEAGSGSAVKLAEVTEDFSVLEFSFYIADMYRETAGAEIGLINHGIAYRGNLVRLFAGDVFDSYLYPIKPRSFANGSTLVKATMTGAQLRNALNDPVGNECTTNSIYAYSGLRCRVAPWNEQGTKYLSVKLADGKALEDDRLYTVAFWEGTVADAYITETLETYEGTWETLMEAKMRADGTLAPTDDGRIQLVWK